MRNDTDDLISRQPEKHTEKRMETYACDCISRQAAIDAADRADYTGLAVEDVKKVTDEVVKELKRLPSAQPEITRCKDCEHWTNDDCPFAWGKVEDAFCSYAERRTDE